jgi:hypothetical protein
MTFRIGFERGALRDEAPDHYMVGRAYMSDGELSFLSGTERISTALYEEHWRSALTTLANGSTASVGLWTDLPTEPDIDFGFVLALYAEEGGLVKVRELLVFPGSTRSGNELDWLAYEPPDFAEFNDDGLPISTWHTSLAEIAEFLA